MNPEQLLQKSAVLWAEPGRCDVSHYLVQTFLRTYALVSEMTVFTAVVLDCSVRVPNSSKPAIWHRQVQFSSAWEL